MKKTYQKPAIKVVDFTYDEQITAQSLPLGIQARPTHPTDCQYSANRVPACNQIYVAGVDCLLSPMSLRPPVFDK